MEAVPVQTIILSYDLRVDPPSDIIPSGLKNCFPSPEREYE
jgi:hypothetical protein